jgi:hypothetical protein
MIALISLSLFALACNNGSDDEQTTGRKNGFTPELKTKEDSLYHEVMEGHDAGMAKVGKLRKNINETQRLLDSLDKMPAQKINASYKQSLIELQTALKNADKEMFDWMGRFKADSASDNKEMRLKYLEEEKQKVTVVKDQIFSALQQADSVLSRPTP